ncbi:MAG: sugar phosphate isomerase/epimerase, partial [Bacteroidales bacterium]|nr:sugar phosphate isomerase/epimerase [Bacteroidales bacterium]
MRLSFSTRGWMDLAWEDILDSACEMRFTGVEMYNVLKFPEFTGKGGPLHKYSVAASYRDMRERGLQVPCFDSSNDLSEENEAMLEEMEALIRLAADMRSPYVCAFAKSDKPETIRRNLSRLVPVAEECGITILIKTSGIYADTALLRDLMNDFACDQLAALWDVHHPYRDHGESPADSITNLGAYVKHVHLRDSDSSGAYTVIGEGDFPVGEVMNALSSIDYDGFVSLEWKPEWMDDLTDREVIFPHFVNYMERFERSRDKKTKLYPNHDGTGFYIWKKDELIDLTFP